jgi:hypothetical protein
MYRFWASVLLFSLCSLFLHGQEESIEIFHDSVLGLYTLDSLKPGQTVFQTARAYEVSMAALENSNPALDFSDMQIGDYFRIPVNPDFIQTSPPSDVPGKRVIYKVRKGDTVYRIAKHYLSTEVSTLSEMNRSMDMTLSLNQPITVGWISYTETPISPITPIKEPERERAYVQPLPSAQEWPLLSSSRYQSLFRDDLAQEEFKTETSQDSIEEVPIKLVRKRGIALWEEEDLSKGEYLVIHLTARLYTEITLYNPMMKRKVNALVVGHIPEKTYPDDISVVISPEVASALGALDRRFVVDMTYIE